MKVHELIEDLRTRNLNDEVEVEVESDGAILTVTDVSDDGNGHTVLYVGGDG